MANSSFDREMFGVFVIMAVDSIATHRREQGSTRVKDCNSASS